MKMKKSNDQKSAVTGFGSQGHEKIEEESADVKSLSILKDNFRLNTTGTDDDLAVDIQDALGREMSLSLVVDNIEITVEGEIVTLEGKVYREEEKMTAGDIATAFAGDDNVNNYLRVTHGVNSPNENAL
jgi:osmotically-inducible protein OsmY